MSSIHDSSIRFLIELDNDLANHTSETLLIKRVKDAKYLDVATVELVEKTLDIIALAHKEQGWRMDGLLEQFYRERGETVKSRDELLLSVEEGLIPLLDQVKQLSGTGLKAPTLSGRVQQVIERLMHPPHEEAPPDSMDRLGQGLWSFAKSVVGTGVSRVAGFVLGRHTPHYDTLCQDYRTRLEAKTESKAAAEFSRVTAKKITLFLEAQVLHVEQYDPLVRPAFLKGDIFTDETVYTKNPQAAVIGKLLIDLLSHAKPELEQIIEVNLLKASENIVDKIKELRQENEFFLVDLCRKCLEDIAGHTDKVPSLAEFSQNIVEVIFNMAFPEGKDGLIMPEFAGASRLVVKDKLWGLIQNVVKEQIGTLVGEMEGKEDLKELLMLEGYENLRNLLQEVPGAKQAQPRALEFSQNTVKTLTFAPIGFAFLFLKILFTSIFTRVTGSEITVDEKKRYRDQGSFNDHLTTIAKDILLDTDDWLLKYIAKNRLEGLVKQHGPQLVEAIRQIEFIDIFNKQLENVVKTVIFPGGAWDEKDGTYKIPDQVLQDAPNQFPKTAQEQMAKDAAAKAEAENRSKKVDETKNEIGKNIDGLLHHLTEAVQLKPVEKPANDASRAEKIVKKLHQLWISFANSCIYYLMKLGAFLLNAKGKVQKTTGALHRRMEAVQQDDFVLTVGNFTALELKKRPTTS